MTRRSVLLRSLLLLGVLVATVWTAPPVAGATGDPHNRSRPNSLRDAFRKILPLFEAHNKDINVRVIYGPSQTLSKQIEEAHRSMYSYLRRLRNRPTREKRARHPRHKTCLCQHLVGP